MEKDGIPFNIELTFIKEYDLINDNQNEEWFIIIKDEVDNNIIIP